MQGGQQGEEESDRERDQERDQEHNFIILDKDLEGVQIEMIPGNKKNAEWLAINKSFICTQKDKSVNAERLLLLLYFCSQVYLPHLVC